MDIGTAFRVITCIAGLGLAAPSGAAQYSAGQVWQYNTRPQDAGSLLKIQKITALGQRQVYHISVIGIHFTNPQMAGVLPHMPVSRETLDASVTKPSSSKAAFPPLSAVDQGIAQWESAQGGIFTIPVSDIVGLIDKQMSQAAPAASN